MTQIKKILLSYKEVRKLFQTHHLQQSEIPLEHAVSLPMPTNRWTEPAYAFFASPALRRPGKPTEQAPPDRWWLLSAHGGRLILYTLWKVFPYVDKVAWGSVALPPIKVSIEEYKEQINTIEQLMDIVVPDFFANQPGNASTRSDLRGALMSHLPEPLQPQYRAIAPDFFDWLEL